MRGTGQNRIRRLMAAVSAILVMIIIGIYLYSSSETYVPPVVQWQYDRLVRQGAQAYPSQDPHTLFGRDVIALVTEEGIDFTSDASPSTLMPLYRVVSDEVTYRATLQLDHPQYVGVALVGDDPRYWTTVTDYQDATLRQGRKTRMLNTQSCRSGSDGSDGSDDERYDFCSWFMEAYRQRASLVQYLGTSDEVYFMMKNGRFTPLSPVAKQWVCSTADKETLLDAMSAYSARLHAGSQSGSSSSAERDDSITCYGG